MPETTTAAPIAMRVTRAGAPLRAETMEIAPPPSGWVRVDVAACGVCHADVGTAAAEAPHTVFPVTPGHEIAGTVADVGAGVVGWSVGDRVAVGWFGGSCGQCRFCQAGDVVHCPERMVPGRSYPGGWAHSVTVPVSALARIAAGMDFTDAAPMGCAGVTTFRALRDASLPGGAVVAVFGLGGLGHLAVQFAAAMGHRTIAIARGADRAEAALALGADTYIDSTAGSAGEALATLGGADLVLATAATTAPLADLLPGLAVRGRLTLIGADSGAVPVPAAQLVVNEQTVTGHLTGSACDIEETMAFACGHGVRPVVERMPLTQANAAVARVASGHARFRIVLETRGAA